MEFKDEFSKNVCSADLAATSTSGMIFLKNGLQMFAIQWDYVGEK